MSVEIFKTLNDLKDALNSNNVQDISAQIDNLKNAQNQITLNQSLSGSKANYIEVSEKQSGRSRYPIGLTAFPNTGRGPCGPCD